MFGYEGSGRSHTTAAHRDAGDFTEGGAAKAAIFRKDERKKGNRNPADCLRVDVWRC
jgi:hypothetical protein